MDPSSDKKEPTPPVAPAPRPVPAATPTAQTSSTPSTVIQPTQPRPIIVARPAIVPPKVEAPVRPVVPMVAAPDHRDHKHIKDNPKLEEVSEYITHGVDPAAPIYEITHAIPDALVLKCADCQRFARVQPGLPGMELLPGPGDRGVHFKCSRCGGGQQVFRHSEKTWLEITLTSLYNLELQDKNKESRRFFHVRQEICSFADRNWDTICLGRTRTPTWWATLNAQITTRTDLFETSKHGSGNWALRHSNISHPNSPSDPSSSIDPALQIPPEKPTTIKLNATAIINKRTIADRRFYQVTLEGSTATPWRDSTHPNFKNGELFKKYAKAEAAKEAFNKPKASPRPKTSPVMVKPLSVNSVSPPLGVSLGVFTEKVIKTPSRLSRRQQSKHDAALAAAKAAAAASGSKGGPFQKQLSPIAEAYRKTAKLAAGYPDTTVYAASSSRTMSSASSGAIHASSSSYAGSIPTSNLIYIQGPNGTMIAMTKLPNGTMVSALPLTKATQAPQPMRCHQCNRRQLSRPKPGQEFIFCTHNAGSVPCTQSYCRTCVDLIYHENPLHDDHELATWVCPACRHICTCAPCNDPTEASSQLLPPNHSAQMQSHMSAAMLMSNSAPSSASSSTTAYDSSDSPIEDSSSTTTTYAGSSASSHATPTGSVSLSPNVSLWPSGAGNGVPHPPSGKGPMVTSMLTMDKSQQVLKSCCGIAAQIDRGTKVRLLVKTSESQAPSSFKWFTEKKPKEGQELKHHSKIEAHHFETFESDLKIVIPAYDPNALPPKKEVKAPVVPQPSPHNTRSNSGSRSSQHPLSLYTQTLVSRGNGSRRKQPEDLMKMTPSEVARATQQYAASVSSNRANQRSLHHHQQQQALYVSTQPRRPQPRALEVSPILGAANGYDGLPSPSGDMYGDKHNLFRNKGKRPHSDLTASANDVGRRKGMPDPYNPTAKRRALNHIALDDMGDLLGANEMHSPRNSFGHFSDDEDGIPLRSATLQHPPHPHHHPMMPHSLAHVLDPDAMVKDTDMSVTDPLAPAGVMHSAAMMMHPHAMVPAAESIDPSQILDLHDVYYGEESLDPTPPPTIPDAPTDSWADNPIMVPSEGLLDNSTFY